MRYVHCALRAQGWEVYIYRNIYLYWIHAANNLASMLQVYVDIGYILPKIWE